MLLTIMLVLISTICFLISVILLSLDLFKTQDKLIKAEAIIFKIANCRGYKNAIVNNKKLAQSYFRKGN